MWLLKNKVFIKTNDVISWERTEPGKKKSHTLRLLHCRTSEVQTKASLYALQAKGLYYFSLSMRKKENWGGFWCSVWTSFLLMSQISTLCQRSTDRYKPIRASSVKSGILMPCKRVEKAWRSNHLFMSPHHLEDMCWPTHSWRERKSDTWYQWVWLLTVTIRQRSQWHCQRKRSIMTNSPLYFEICKSPLCRHPDELGDVRVDCGILD